MQQRVHVYRSVRPYRLYCDVLPIVVEPPEELASLQFFSLQPVERRSLDPLELHRREAGRARERERASTERRVKRAQECGQAHTVVGGECASCLLFHGWDRELNGYENKGFRHDAVGVGDVIAFQQAACLFTLSGRFATGAFHEERKLPLSHRDRFHCSPRLQQPPSFLGLIVTAMRSRPRIPKISQSPLVREGKRCDDHDSRPSTKGTRRREKIGLA